MTIDFTEHEGPSRCRIETCNLVGVFMPQVDRLVTSVDDRISRFLRREHLKVRAFNEPVYHKKNLMVAIVILHLS